VTSDTTTDAAAEYAARRADDWAAFTSKSGPGADRWAAWAEMSHQWKNAVEFLQPVGLDYPSYRDPLQPLLDKLGGMEELDLPPLDATHLTVLRLGFLMSTDILWSQTESFYVNAAPRIHRVSPFSIRIGAISAREDALYLGVDDGHAFREVRRQIRLGVMKAAEMLKHDPDWSPEGDSFMPVVPFAYFTGLGDRARVIEAVEPYLDIQLGEYPVTHIKMGRVASDPEIHYPGMDVIAEIGLLGQEYRKGYHN
jgi:hypothetical protein